MPHVTRRQVINSLALAMVTVSDMAWAESASVINRRVNLALTTLYASVAHSKSLAEKAVGILIMPDVTKGGFIIGGSYGEGGLLINDPATGFDHIPNEYYSVASASFGFQAGLQTSSHALFFMTDEALDKFRKADGWEIGGDLEVTVPDNGLNAQINTTIAQKPVIGVVFGADGLLLGASLEGAKYSRIER